MSWVSSRPVVAAWASALAAGVAAASPPLLPGSAFALPSPCAVDPFGEPSIEQRERVFERQCGLDRLHLAVAAPRVNPIHTGPNKLELEVDQVLTRRIDALTASARLGWAGGTEEGFGRFHTGRALIAAGGLLRIDDHWALDLHVGRDVGPGLRSRATVAGLWRPAGEHLVYLQLAAEDAGVANAAGLRWWLKPGRAVLDVSARRSADGQSVEPRVGLQVFDFGL